MSSMTKLTLVYMTIYCTRCYYGGLTEFSEADTHMLFMELCCGIFTVDLGQIITLNHLDTSKKYK